MANEYALAYPARPVSAHPLLPQIAFVGLLLMIFVCLFFTAERS